MSGKQESWSKWGQQMPSTQQCLIRLIMMMENIDNDDGNTLIRLIMMMEILW